MPKVLIADKMSPLAKETFEKRGVEAVEKTGLSPQELKAEIQKYDGIAVRSSSQITAEILDAASDLKVIGRAGIGVDNIDVQAATAAGVIVMNTPFGNSITTAEHAIAMMMSLARQIPQANESTHKGKWEKKKFMGVELYGKTLGIIGCGNIGSIVANRALGLKMNIVAFDPYLTEDKAHQLSVKRVSLDDLLAQSDFITMHVPKNEKTANLLNKEKLAKTKKGVRIVNCARGGIIDEEALKEFLDSGHVAGAALDVFAKEPATHNILFNHPNVICTPHLGASTEEAQVNVALQIADQMADYLLTGAVTNALNMPSISAEDAPKLKPYMKLASQLGSFAGQITDHAIREMKVTYEGSVADLNFKPLTSIITASLLKPQLDTVNMVNALQIAQDRNITISETSTGSSKDFRSFINVEVITEKRKRNVTGTLFTGKEPRIVNVEDVPIEAAILEHMLYIRNNDKPGLIGQVGTILGDANCNIADFRLGRKADSGEAVALICLDSAPNDEIMSKLEKLDNIKQIKVLHFDQVKENGKKSNVQNLSAAAA